MVCGERVGGKSGTKRTNFLPHAGYSLPTDNPQASVHTYTHMTIHKGFAFTPLHGGVFNTAR